MNHAANLFSEVIKQIGNDINVVMIGQIDSYNSLTNMATVIPLHIIPGQGQDYPPLINVPVGFFSIGGYSIKVQPSKGDRLLILFCDYDIENLLINGTKDNKTSRTHSLNDAIAIPLSINFLNNVSNISEDLIISKEGTTAYIKLTNDGNIVLNSSKIICGEGAIQQVQLYGGDASTVLYAK